MKAPSRFSFKQAVQLFAIDPDGLVTLALIAMTNDRLFPYLAPPEPIVVVEYGLKGSPFLPEKELRVGRIRLSLTSIDDVTIFRFVS